MLHTTVTDELRPLGRPLEQSQQTHYSYDELQTCPFLCQEYLLGDDVDEAPCNFILSGPQNL